MGMTVSFLRVTEKEIEAYKKNSEKFENRFFSEERSEDPDFLDIDKSWDGIIFLLTGQSVQNTSDELLSIIFSRNFLDKTQNFGFGPAHYLTSEEVKTINNKISSLTIEDLKLKFNPNKMMELEVYPQIWNEGEVAFEYLSKNFIALKEFYKVAAQNNQAIVSLLF